MGGGVRAGLSCEMRERMIVRWGDRGAARGDRTKVMGWSEWAPAVPTLGLFAPFGFGHGLGLVVRISLGAFESLSPCFTSSKKLNSNRSSSQPFNPAACATSR